MKRKIDLMHDIFGELPEKRCKTCDHLIKRQYARTHYKCECYGTSCSESSDWKVSNVACGLWNKPYFGNPGIKLVDRSTKKPEIEIPGQMSMFE